jgi:preprotein translocase subunit YajC
MQFDNQTTRNVADIVARILAGESVKQEPKMLEEELVGNQHKIDANKNNKIDAHDFKLLRKKKKVEEETELTESHFKIGDEVICKASGMEGEVVKIDEPQTGKYYTVKQENGKMVKYAPNELKKEEEDEDEEDDEDENKMKSEEVHNKKKDDTPSTSNSVKKPVRNSDGTIQSPISRARELAQQGLKKAMSKEEVEELDEAMFPGTKEYEKKFGQSPQQKLKKKGDTVPTSQGDMTKTDKGIAHRRRFTEMLESYTEGGLKYIATLVQEEPDNEEYTKEVEDQKAKMDGKKKGGDVAKASVQAVKNEEVEELDELSKSTLASYAKKASHEARMKHGIGKDFERISKSSRKPEYKQGAKEWEDKYKSDARRREAGVGKAIDRLAKEEVELDEAINHLQMAKHHQAIAKEHDRISHKAAGNDEDDLSIAHSDQSEVHQDAAKAHLQAHKTGNPKDVASAKKATKQSLQNDTTRIMRSNYTHFYNVTKGRKSSTGEDDHKDYNYSELRSGADAIKKGLNEETEIQVINADIANGVEQIDIEEGAKETATRARELADKLSRS